MEPKSPKDTVYKVRNMRTEIPYIILSNPYPDCDDPPTSDRRQRVVPRGRPIPTCLIPFTLAYGVSGRALGEVIGPTFASRAPSSQCVRTDPAVVVIADLLESVASIGKGELLFRSSSVAELSDVDAVVRMDSPGER
jgi:hypothetical protein